VVTSAYCGTIGNEYYDAKHALCSQVQQGVGMIALSTFLIALFLIPALIFSWVRAREEEDVVVEDMVFPKAPLGIVMSSPSSPAYSTVNSPSMSVVREERIPPALPARPVGRGTAYPVAYAPPYTPQYAAASYGESNRYEGEGESR